MDKLHFLKVEFPKLVSTLAPDAKGEWGVLNAQQMIEHMADSVSQATGNNTRPLHTPVEHLEKFKTFAMSDKEFKPNTKNAVMSETPPPIEKASVAEAVAELEKQIAAFEDYFWKNKGAAVTNQFFGDLNFEEWIHLLHKHAVHHAKQFRLL